MFKKNASVSGFGIGNFINATTGATVTTGTPTCKRTLDGTAGACANAAAYDATGLVWKIDLAAGDLNGDIVALSFTLADCLPINYTIRTSTKLVSDLNDVGGTAQTGDSYAVVAHVDYGNAKLVRSATPANTLTVDANGLADANTVKVGPTGAGTAQTARDIGASVLLSSGTGTGQLSITSGVVAANATQISGDSTAADNAEAFFDGTGYAGTNNVIPTVTTTGTATNLTNLPAAAATAAELAKVPKSDSNVSWNATALAALQQEATDALNAYDPPTNAEMIARTLVAASYFDPAADTVAAVTTVGSVTGAVGSVTGAVGSVTGAVGSVTGNVGGNVTGSVGSVVGDTKQTADVATLITTVGVAGAGLTALATAAALDAVDNFLDTEVAAILADTNELQTDWTNGGRLDLLLDGATAPSAADIKTALEANGSKLDHLWEMTEDDGGVRRLTANALEEAPTGGSAPTAATIADAVWDELSTGHTSAGKAGEQLWTDIDAIKGRTDTIGALTVTLTAPVATSGNAITVIRGDDYLNADGRALAFTGTNWPVITGGAVALIVRFPTVTSYTGVVTGAAACYIELTDTQTALLTPGVYDYDLQATLAGVGGSVITLAQGTFTVSADVR